MLAACAATVLCWPAPVPTFHTTWMYDNIVYYRTPAVVGACFTAAILLAVVVAGWGSLSVGAGPRPGRTGELLATLSFVLLPLPFMYSALSGVVALWWTRFVPQGVLASLYLGLAGAAWVAFSMGKRGRSPANGDSRAMPR